MVPILDPSAKPLSSLSLGFPLLTEATLLGLPCTECLKAEGGGGERRLWETLITLNSYTGRVLGRLVGELSGAMKLIGGC